MREHCIGQSLGLANCLPMRSLGAVHVGGGDIGIAILVIIVLAAAGDLVQFNFIQHNHFHYLLSFFCGFKLYRRYFNFQKGVISSSPFMLLLGAAVRCPFLTDPLLILAGVIPAPGQDDRETPGDLFQLSLVQFNFVQHILKHFRLSPRYYVLGVSQVRAYDNTPTVTEVAHGSR